MLGALSEITGQRPSTFFGWNEEDEWQDRLFFDLQIVGILKREEKKQMDDAQRKMKRK